MYWLRLCLCARVCLCVQTDTIESLADYTGTSKPQFLFYGKDTLVQVLRGANSPKIAAVIEAELTKEHDAIDNGTERVPVSRRSCIPVLYLQDGHLVVYSQNSWPTTPSAAPILFIVWAACVPGLYRLCMVVAVVVVVHTLGETFCVSLVFATCLPPVCCVCVCARAVATASPVHALQLRVSLAQFSDTEAGRPKSAAFTEPAKTEEKEPEKVYISPGNVTFALIKTEVDCDNETAIFSAAAEEGLKPKIFAKVDLTPEQAAVFYPGVEGDGLAARASAGQATAIIFSNDTGDAAAKWTALMGPEDPTEGVEEGEESKTLRQKFGTDTDSNALCVILSDV